MRSGFGSVRSFRSDIFLCRELGSVPGEEGGRGPLVHRPLGFTRLRRKSLVSWQLLRLH